MQASVAVVASLGTPFYKYRMGSRCTSKEAARNDGEWLCSRIEAL